MIQNENNSSRKIKENKYKILRMSLLLGTDTDKEETINNFEDAAREIDFMNNESGVFYKYTLSFILNQYFILYFIFLYIMHKSISTYLHI